MCVVVVIVIIYYVEFYNNNSNHKIKPKNNNISQKFNYEKIKNKETLSFIRRNNFFFIYSPIDPLTHALNFEKKLFSFFFVVFCILFKKRKCIKTK
jgi:Ca2+/Na+ antiporter